MSALLAAAPELPLGTSGRYVAAAYIVVLAVILIYVAIMATRAQRLERELEELRRDVEAARAGDAPRAGPGAGTDGDTVLSAGERRSA